MTVTLDSRADTLKAQTVALYFAVRDPRTPINASCLPASSPLMHFVRSMLSPTSFRYRDTSTIFWPSFLACAVA